MKQLETFSIGLAAFALTAAGALADWYRAAELSANGGAKEVGAVFENVRAVRIQCLEGSVAIGTLRVRSGSEKEEYHVDRPLGEGETHDIALDGREVTGFHVIDRGTGRYCIDVRADGAQPYYEHHHHHIHHYGRHPSDPPPTAGNAVAPAQTPGKTPPGVKGAPDAPGENPPAKKLPVKKVPTKKAPARRGPPKGR